MSRCPHMLRGRTTELLAGEAIGDLDEIERAELDLLTGILPHVVPDELMRAAALAQLALLRQQPVSEPLPAALKSRLQNLANEWATKNIPAVPPAQPPSTTS